MLGASPYNIMFPGQLIRLECLIRKPKKGNKKSIT